MNYKFRLNYRDEQFLGNSADDIALALSKSKRISIEEANIIVSKLLVKAVPILQKDFNPKEIKGLKFSDVLNGAMSMLKTSSGITVSQDDINSRAIKCSNCPKLSSVSDCRACGFTAKFGRWLNEFKKKFNKGFEIPNNLSDKYCSVCSCSLIAMLPAQKEDFKTESESVREQRPKFCWILD